MIVLDTHVLLWMDRDDAALGQETRRLIEHAWRTGTVAVSAISFWETAMLARRGRIALPAPASAWRSDWLHAGLTEIPLDGATALLAAELPNFHPDPADRFIAATALRHGGTLITADSQILAWPASLPRQDARA